jgi:geranylgeranyl transferase type-2 subunit alpha
LLKEENVLTEEYEFVRHALFTDPDDQSAWFYHLLLLDQTVKLERLSISSWPPHDSNLYLSVDGLLDCCAVSPSLLSNSQTFPLILYFSEAVEGINSSTVAVECEYDRNNDLIWRPIQANKSGQAHAWLTYLNFPTEERHPSKVYQVKASIGHSPGIISSSGVCCSHSSCIVFTVSAPTSTSKYGEGHHRIESINWAEENFCLFETDTEYLGLVNSFYQLSISEDPKAYEKNIDIIEGEIAYCRLLSDWYAGLFLLLTKFMVLQIPSYILLFFFAVVKLESLLLLDY